MKPCEDALPLHAGLPPPMQSTEKAQLILTLSGASGACSPSTSLNAPNFHYVIYAWYAFRDLCLYLLQNKSLPIHSKGCPGRNQPSVEESFLISINLLFCTEYKKKYRRHSLKGRIIKYNLFNAYSSSPPVHTLQVIITSHQQWE